MLENFFSFVQEQIGVIIMEHYNRNGNTEERF